jgi:DNA polymerase III delta prime subunit
MTDPDEPTLSQRDASEDILRALDRVASWAKAQLEAHRGGGLVDPGGIAALQKIQAEQQSILTHSIQEPLVARVVVESAPGEVTTYYICRGAAAGVVDNLGGRLASYRAHVGRLAELDIGEELEIPAGRNKRVNVRIVARGLFRPRKVASDWDAAEAQLDFAASTAWSLSELSLRAYLDRLGLSQGVGEGALSLLMEIEAATRDDEEAFEIRRRHVIERISLRDQPTLDKFQGAVFRLPIDKRLLLIGPPGTGKTTTLIKRIAHKQTVNELEDDERELLDDLGVGVGSWRMYSPTELLSLYLRDAFNKERVPATQHHIRTWDDDRRDLARNVFPILRGNKSGRWVVKDDLRVFRGSSRDLCDLHDSFAQYLDAAVVLRCQTAIASASKLDSTIAKTSVQLMHAYDSSGLDVGKLHRIRANDGSRLDGLTSGHQAEIEATHRTILTRIDRTLLERLIAGVVDLLAAVQPNNVSDDGEDEDDDAVGLANTDAARRSNALKVVRDAIGRRGELLVVGRPMTARMTRVLELLGDHAPSDDECRVLGEHRIVARSLRVISGAASCFVSDIPREYAVYRRRQDSAKWYVRDGAFIASTEFRDHVAPDEVDVMLLLALRNTRRLRQLVPGQPWYRALDERVVTQLYVDEVTDFSAVQLACMLELTHPKLRSFFACGDFHQRVEAHGIVGVDEMRWVSRQSGSDDFEIKEISTLYRQSRALRGLADDLATLQEGRSLRPSSAEAAAGDPKPLLKVGIHGDAVAEWLSDRILEIERLVGSLPSIAVFVDGEAAIAPLVTTAAARLETASITIVGCHGGRVVGDAQEVRVFDIKHIKGLEFEAVFFVGVDRLAARLPQLFDRYIYVGVTRAATYLGITCEVELPGQLADVRHHFDSGGW